MNKTLTELSDEELVLATQKLVAKSKDLESEILRYFIEIKHRRLNIKAGLTTLADFAEAHLGLTRDQAAKRSQAAAVVEYFPEMLDLLRAGKTSLTHLALIAPKITAANCEIFAREITSKSTREVRDLVKRVSLSGEMSPPEPYQEVKLSLDARQMAKLEKARVLVQRSKKSMALEDALSLILDEYIARHDPMSKATRAMERKRKREGKSERKKDKDKRDENAAPQMDQEVFATEHAQDVDKQREIASVNALAAQQMNHEVLVNVQAEGNAAQQRTSPTTTGKQETSSRYIPTHLRHAVFVRDQGQCSYVNEVGERCQQTNWLEVEHRVPYAVVKKHELDNLRLACRFHNSVWAYQAGILYTPQPRATIVHG